VLPNTPTPGAIGVAEKMCRNVAELGIVHRGSDLERVSISVGLATLVPSTANAQHQVVEAADAAMYRAKEGGRNRVATGEYVGEAPAAHRRFEGRNNLPLDDTSFTGRERELKVISKTLPVGQVISLLGPGGVGKTRLAIVAARAALSTFPGGAWLVELGPERDGSAVCSRVADALGVEPTCDAVIASLSAQPALIILDSCEHLLDACAELVATIERRCPDTRVITTSRQPLGLPNEARIRLEPFAPDDAIRLFVERARSAQPSATFDERADELIRAICEHADGLPLAIELAAARLGTLTLEQLAARGGTLPQATALNDRIASSFALLDAGERRFLARLSVLEGSFGEDAARAIAGGDAFDTFESFDLLTRLVDKSLIQVDLGSGQYRLLGAIAQWFRARLADYDPPDEIRGTAARYFASQAAALHDEMRDAARVDTLARYSAIVEGAEAALDWSLGGGDLETGAALVADLVPYWLETGHIALARDRAQRAISQAMRLSRRRIIDVTEAAFALAVAGGDPNSVRELAVRLQSETGASHDPSESARVEFALGVAAALDGEDEKALRRLQAAREAFGAGGEARGIVRALEAMADIVARRQALEGRLLLEQAHELVRRTGPPSLTIRVVDALAEVLAKLNESHHAIELVRDTAAQFAEVGDEVSLAWTSLLLAARELEGDPIVARMHARSALERLRVSAHPGGLASCFEALAEIASRDGDDVIALELLTFAAALRRRHGIAGSMRERRAAAQLLAQLETRLDLTHFEQGVRTGRTMSLDTALATAHDSALGTERAPAFAPA
ncbi:MAG: diguanylate cyclase, partial [Candidatus Eremiobacteraeota bacterium]|nr:diguanylate cyclase [Candidatus Eremiobacteraeota bacterium]